MAGNEHGVVAHGPQALRDAADQIVIVATREVAAPNAACKQHIAHKRTLEFRRVKHHMAGRVPRAMTHLQGVLAEGHGVVVMQPTRGFERRGRWEAVVHGGRGQVVNPKLIAFMGADDGQVQLLGQFGRGACMVNVGVGDPNLFKLDAEFCAGVEQHGEISAWIDDGRLHGFVTPHNGTILLKWRNGNGLIVQHDLIVNRT